MPPPTSHQEFCTGNEIKFIIVISSPTQNSPPLGHLVRCNILFEQLVLEMGYEAESARQAIMAMPGSIMDEIIDYIIDKEAVFAAYRRFKASLVAK